MVTLVERSSRHTLLAALPDSYDAANTAKTVTQALARQRTNQRTTKTPATQTHQPQHQKPHLATIEDSN